MLNQTATHGIGPSVIGAGGGVFCIDLDDQAFLPGLEVEVVKTGFGREEKPIPVDPAGSRSLLIELPYERLRGGAAEKFPVADVEPEQLLAQRVPQGAFAETAIAIVKKFGFHDHTALGRKSNGSVTG